MDGLWKRTRKGTNEERKADEDPQKRLGLHCFIQTGLIYLATLAFDEGQHGLLWTTMNCFSFNSK